jgi:hypothetical protein
VSGLVGILISHKWGFGVCKPLGEVQVSTILVEYILFVQDVKIEP